MTTLAIIGAGFAGRSLIYTLAKEGHSYSRILLFSSEPFAPACSLRSTAIVAPRGVTSGHSSLGDLLVAGFQTFSLHVSQDRPAGIYPIDQYTIALTKQDNFRARYPQGEISDLAGPLKLKRSHYMAYEQAFVLEPTTYLTWLRANGAPVEEVSSFVTEVKRDVRWTLKTADDTIFEANRVVFAGGNYNRFWKGLTPSMKIASSRPVRGGYLEFDLELPMDSVSLTLEGMNLIYNHHYQKLIIGSTTDESNLCLTPERDLRGIYDSLAAEVSFELPPFESGRFITGLREKSSRREPYCFSEGGLSFIGGFYKNGCSLSLHLARELVRQF